MSTVQTPTRSVKRHSRTSRLVHAAVVALAVLGLALGPSASAATCFAPSTTYQNLVLHHLVATAAYKTQYLQQDPVPHTEYWAQLPGFKTQYGWLQTTGNHYVYSVNQVYAMKHVNEFTKKNGSSTLGCFFAFGQEAACPDGHTLSGYSWSCHYNVEYWTGVVYNQLSVPASRSEPQANPACVNPPKNNPLDPDYQTSTVLVTAKTTVYQYDGATDFRDYGVSPGNAPTWVPAYYANGDRQTQAVKIWLPTAWQYPFPGGTNGVDYIWSGGTRQAFDHWGPAYWTDTVPRNYAGHINGTDFLYQNVTQVVRAGSFNAAVWVDTLPGGTNGPDPYVNDYTSTVASYLPPEGDGINRTIPGTDTNPVNTIVINHNPQPVTCELRPT